MITSDILKFVDLSKIQKSKCLANKRLYFPQITKSILDTLKAIKWQIWFPGCNLQFFNNNVTKQTYMARVHIFDGSFKKPQWDFQPGK